MMSNNPKINSNSSRYRAVWTTFLTWYGAKRHASTKEIQAIEARWSMTSVSQIAEKKRAIQERLVTEAREEWQTQLAYAGLTTGDLEDMTAEEVGEADRIFQFESSPSLLNTHHSSYNSVFASPILSTPSSSHESLKSYDFIDAKSFRREKDEIDEEFDGLKDIGDLAGHGLENFLIAQHNEVPEFVPTPQSQSSSSSSASSPQTPSDRMLNSYVHIHSQSQSPYNISESLPVVSPPSKSPLYIGPVIFYPDDIAEEDGFDRYKTELCENKIREFHQEAAEADIQQFRVLREMWATTSRTERQKESKRRIAAHNEKMDALRRRKDEEATRMMAQEKERRERVKKPTPTSSAKPPPSMSSRQSSTHEIWIPQGASMEVQAKHRSSKSLTAIPTKRSPPQSSSGIAKSKPEPKIANIIPPAPPLLPPTTEQPNPSKSQPLPQKFESPPLKPESPPAIATLPPAISQKRPIELQSAGASSSKVTLDQMRVPSLPSLPLPKLSVPKASSMSSSSKPLSPPAVSASSSASSKSLKQSKPELHQIWLPSSRVPVKDVKEVKEVREDRKGKRKVTVEEVFEDDTPPSIRSSASTSAAAPAFTSASTSTSMSTVDATPKKREAAPKPIHGTVGADAKLASLLQAMEDGALPDNVDISTLGVIGEGKEWASRTWKALQIDVV